MLLSLLNILVEIQISIHLNRQPSAFSNNYLSTVFHLGTLTSPAGFPLSQNDLADGVMSALVVD